MVGVGVSGVKVAKQQEAGHLVKEYTLPSGPHIRIYDDFVVREGPEREALDERIAEVILRGYLSAPG